MKRIATILMASALILVPASALAAKAKRAQSAPVKTTGTAKQATPTAGKDASMTKSAIASIPAVASDDVSITRLANGLTVAVKKDARFPLASLRLYVHAGSAYETPDIAGISHQLEHMVFKGTKNRPKGAVAADVEKAGGYLNAGTSYDYTVYLTDMPAAQWKLGMEVLKEMAFEPTLDPKELEAEKDVVLSELQRGEDAPMNRMFKRVTAQTLKGTPYERPIIGFPETIKKYTPEAMRAYIAALYQPQSMMLLVVGDVDNAAVLEEATRLFGSIPNTATVTPPRRIPMEEVALDRPTVVMETTPWKKVHLSVSFPSVDSEDTRSALLSIFANRLGGDKTSYLYKKYKYEKRLVDSVSVGDYSFERTGLFTMTFTLDVANVAPFWKEFAKDLPKLASLDFSPEELDRARLAILDDAYRQRETVAGTASSLGHFLFFSGPEGEANYLRTVQLADKAAVARTAAEILKPERVAVTILVPEDAKPVKPVPRDPRHGIRPIALPPTPPSVPNTEWFQDTLKREWPAPEAAKANAAAKAEAPAREVIDLGKGRTLILQPDASMPYAAVDMAFAGGDSMNNAELQGLATLTAAALTRGTKTMAAPQLEAYKADRAASLGASSSHESFRIFMDFPSAFAPDMWNLLLETVTKPAFAEAEIERAKENQVAAIVAREDSPTGYAFRKLLPFLFGEQLYGYQSLGDKEVVKALVPDDVTMYWQRQATKPWVLSVCGTFDRKAVIAAAKRFPAPKGKTDGILAPEWGEDKELTLTMPDRQQAHLMLVFPGTDVDSEDMPGLDLLREILAGQSGLLFRDLRDKEGLGYTVTALQWQARLTGAIIFYIGTEPDKMNAASDGFKRVIASIHKGEIAEDDILRGKNQLLGDYVRGRQKMSARSAEAASLAIQGRSLDADRERIDKAQKLTATDIAALARKYLQTDKAYTLKVLPK